MRTLLLIIVLTMTAHSSITTARTTSAVTGPCRDAAHFQSARPLCSEYASQDKTAAVIPAAITFPLSAESTKELISLSQQKAAVARQYADLEERERLLMVGSGVPEAARHNCTIPNGGTLVICAVPALSPEKKP